MPGENAGARGAASFVALCDAVAAQGASDAIGTAYRLYATVHGYVMLELVGMAPVDPDDFEALYEIGLAGCIDP